MKAKIVGVLVVTVSAVLLGTSFVFSRDTSQTKDADKASATENTVTEDSRVDSSSKSNTIEDDYIVDFEDTDGEQLYTIFKDANAADIISLLDQFNKDSDRVVVTSDGEVLNGKFGIKNIGSDEINIDTATDPNGITVYNLKALIEAHKDEINELANKHS